MCNVVVRLLGLLPWTVLKSYINCGVKLTFLARKMVLYMILLFHMVVCLCLYITNYNWNCSITGNTAVWSHFLDELLGLMVQQKRLILSDKNFLPSFLTCLLSSSCDSILVSPNIEQRYCHVLFLFTARQP